MILQSDFDHTVPLHILRNAWYCFSADTGIPAYNPQSETSSQHILLMEAALRQSAPNTGKICGILDSIPESQTPDTHNQQIEDLHKEQLPLVQQFYQLSGQSRQNDPDANASELTSQ